MGSITDRWTKPGPGGRRVRSERHERGKRWLARWTDDAGRRQSKACATKDEAKALLARVDVELRTGTYVSPTTLTLTDWAATWQARQLHHRASTAAQVESSLRLHVLPALGHLRLTDVTRGHVQDVVAAASIRLAPSTVRVVHTHLRSLLGAAVRERLITSNPAVGVRLPPLPRTRVVPLTGAQVHALAGAVPDRWRVAVLLGAASGMRVSEILGLTWDRVTEAPLPDGSTGALVSVDRQLAGREPGGRPLWGPPKTRASDRRVLVDAPTLEVLRAHRPCFPSPWDLVVVAPGGGALRRQAAQNAWARAAGKVGGLRDRSGWHDLRHYHASVLISAGVSVRAVADRLGHDDPSVTLRTYAHLMPSDEARSLAAIGAALWPGASPVPPDPGPGGPGASLVVASLTTGDSS